MFERIFTDLCIVLGTKLPSTIQTNVCKTLQSYMYICAHLRHITLKHDNFTNVNAFFPLARMDFP